MEYNIGDIIHLTSGPNIKFSNNWGEQFLLIPRWQDCIIIWKLSILIYFSAVGTSYIF